MRSGFQVARCQVCRLGSTLVPEGFDPLALYGEGYFQGNEQDGYADYLASEPVLRQEFRRTLHQLEASKPPGNKLLEVGSAYGFFLAEAQVSFSCMGVEVSEPGVKYSRKQGCECTTAPCTMRCGATDPLMPS